MSDFFVPNAYDVNDKNVAKFTRQHFNVKK